MRKRIIIIAVIVAAVGVIGLGVYSLARNAAEAAKPVTATTEVQNGPLTLSVSASGVVESETVYNVYSSLGYTVDSVLVEEGQYVEKDAVLARLDTSGLELDIRQQQAALQNTETSGDLDIEGKLKAYQNAQQRQGLTVDNARRSYELLAAQVSGGTHPELVSTQNALDNAKTDWEQKTRTYEDNKALFDMGELSVQALDQSKTALETAQRTYDTAVKNREITIKRLNDDVETSRKNLQTTQVTAEQEIGNAKRAYETALAVTSVESAQINLEKLEKQLADATITAPIAGVVTKVYAQEGSPGSGLLFIIEDLDALEIVTAVKEYDAAKVAPGLPVIIKSDATGEKEIAGHVKFIAPTSLKSSTGQTVAANVVEYETIVVVDEPDSGLKVGMNTRLSIILEQKDGVLQVPYDAIYENGGGQFSLFAVDAIEENRKTRHVVRAVPVTVGLETDFAVEVSGDGLSEGMLIVADPLSTSEGAEVNLRDENAPAVWGGVSP